MWLYRKFLPGIKLYLTSNLLWNKAECLAASTEENIQWCLLLATAFTKLRYILRICSKNLSFTFQAETIHWILRIKFDPYNPVQGSQWKDWLLCTDTSERKLVYKTSQPIAETTSNPSMQCGFLRNHQTKYASADCLTRARATKHFLSQGFRNWWRVDTEKNNK